MPPRNQFRHQTYQPPEANNQSCFIDADEVIPSGTHEFRTRMSEVSEAYRAAGIAEIVLIHGSFVGGDGLGILRELAQVSPKLSAQLLSLSRLSFDSLLQDAANFTAAYAALLAKSLNADYSVPIRVRLWDWSGENNHIGRANGAVRLLDDLSERPAEGRVLVWAHSHGGNVLALLSNLLASDPRTIDAFFHAARPFCRWPLTGQWDLPAWRRVRQRLQGRRPLCDPARLDLVTLGTPIRYGWEQNGYRRLLHMVNHRPVAGLPRCAGRFPPTLGDIQAAENGDVVQLLGIAGTNLPPPVWACGAWLADIRLGRLLQRGVASANLLSFWSCGNRIHEDGLTLLVDYGPGQGHPGQHLAGHAVYTRQKWQLFHAEQVAQHLYVSDPQVVGEKE